MERVRVPPDGYGPFMEIVDLTALEGRGPAWGAASDELNATLLVWQAGDGQPDHANAERDVALVALAGSGSLVVDGVEYALAPGVLAIVPRGASRAVVAGPDGLRCLTVHRRRGGLAVSDFRSEPGVGLQSDTQGPARAWRGSQVSD